MDFLDGFVSCNSCDHIRRSYDAWTRFFKTPFTHFFTLPHKVTENSISFFKEEIIRFKNRLEEFFGVKITEESLRQAIEIYNKNRTLLKKLYQLRMADSPPISGAETLDVIMAGMVLPKERHNQMLGKLLEELASKDQGYHSEARLLIAGSELQTSDYIKIIEDLGGLVVTDDLSNGTKYFWDLVNTEGEVTEALARRYLMRNSCTRMFTVEERINQIKEMIEKFRVNGIIYQKIKFCDLMGCIYPVLKKRLTDLGIPILALEKEYGLAGAGQLRTRAQAFLEMITS